MDGGGTTAVSTIHHEAVSNRLRIEGACRDVDRASIQQALEEAAGLADHVIVDLTAATALEPEVAGLLLDVRGRAMQQGNRITLLRKSASHVDRALSTAEAERAGPTATRDEGPSGQQPVISDDLRQRGW